MAKKMDAWGPNGCLEHLPEIFDAMRAGAQHPETNPLRMPFIEPIARWLVLKCCREAEKES
jgi:hypothetical protein